jgi:hypothetical protein
VKIVFGKISKVRRRDKVSPAFCAGGARNYGFLPCFHGLRSNIKAR